MARTPSLVADRISSLKTSASMRTELRTLLFWLGIRASCTYSPSAPDASGEVLTDPSARERILHGVGAGGWKGAGKAMRPSDAVAKKVRARLWSREKGVFRPGLRGFRLHPKP